VSRQHIDPHAHPRAWIEGWYRIIAAHTSCESILAPVPSRPVPHESTGRSLSSDDIELGCYDGDRNTIYVQDTVNPYNDLATILHEVAHYHQNQRHHRAHGYSWRREFVEICSFVFGVDPLPLARECRARGRSWMEALDVAALALAIRDRPVLTKLDDRWRGVIGGRTLGAWIGADPSSSIHGMQVAG
jgi:hypothetical protein